MKKVLFTLVVLCATVFANAEAPLTLDFNAASFNGQAIPPAGYEAYVLTVSTTDGSLITGIDLDTGDFGIFGNLLQVWQNSRGIYTSTPEFNAAFGVGFEDSYLITSPIQPVAATEDNDLSYGALFAPYEMGDGTFIKGAWAIDGASQATSLDIAYIVTDKPISYSAQIATSGGTYVIEQAVPEPATMALLAIGGGLVALRKKRNS